MEDGNCTGWSELHIDFLESIFKRVGVIEYLMCACVCKSWRSAANSFKQKFMASQGPLVFLMSNDDGNHCYFYNMFDERLYRTALPHLAGNKCLGFTCGYLVFSGVTEDRSNIWLVHPFTRHQLEFPKPPRKYNYVILASFANSDGEFVVIAFSKLFSFVQFRRPGDAEWFVYDSRTISRMIVDVAVFKGKLYVLTSQGEIGTLSLNSRPTVTLLLVESVPISQFRHHLVASHEELYLTYFYQKIAFVNSKIFKLTFVDSNIFKLNFEGRKWEAVILRDDVLFLGALKCPGISFPTPSRLPRRSHSHRVYFLGADLIVDFVNGFYTALCVYGLLYMRIPAAPRNWEPPDDLINSGGALWYFPHLSSSVDSVDPVNED